MRTVNYYSSNATTNNTSKSRTNKSQPAPADDNTQSNEPLAYFGSGAAVWTARQGHSGQRDEQVWFQPYVISGSLAVFLIYFCILREENDIDVKLEGSLYEHVAGLEETQLQLSINYNKEHNLSTDALERRMAELESLKQAEANEK